MIFITAGAERNLIDLHSHIIPAVDDGCKDEAMSLAMLRKAAASGTTAIFATSHVLSAGEHPSWETLRSGAESLRKVCKDNDIALEVYSGTEVFMDWELLDELAVNGSYCLNGEAFSKQAVTYILVELPMHFLPQYADDFWYELRLKGVVPILAHPERYPELIANSEKLIAWRNEGLLLQCNAGSFAGKFGEAAERAAKLLLKNHLVDFIGSDAHRDVGRDTDMRAGANVIREIAGEAELQRIAVKNPEKLILGEAIEVAKLEKLVGEKKGFWSRLFG